MASIDSTYRTQGTVGFKLAKDEGRSRSYSQPPSLSLLGTDSLADPFTLQTGSQQTLIAADRSSVASQVRQLERLLIRKQPFSHLPILAPLSEALCSFRSFKSRGV